MPNLTELILYAELGCSPLGFRDRFDLLLKQQKLSRGDVRSVLEEYRDSIGDADGEEEREKRRGRVDKLMKQME